MNKKIQKDELVRMISEKTEFNLADTRDFVNGLIEVLEDIVLEEDILDVRELGRIIYQKLPERKGSPLVTDGEMLPPTTRVHFSLAENITRLAK